MQNAKRSQSNCDQLQSPDVQELNIGRCHKNDDLGIIISGYNKLRCLMLRNANRLACSGGSMIAGGHRPKSESYSEDMS